MAAGSTQYATGMQPDDLDEPHKRLIQLVRSDADEMETFLREKEEITERRYAQHNDREIGVGPWRGASEAWLPLSDMEIAKFKPAMHAALFSRPRVVSMVPLNAQGIQSKAKTEMVMEATLRGRGINSIPDLELQCAYIEDSVGEFGYAIVKTFWEAKTRPGTETVRRDRLPGVLGKLIVKPALSDEQRARIQQATPGINGAVQQDGTVRDPDFERVFGTSDINPVNRRVWKEIAPAVKQEVIDRFDLDPDDELDADACKAIMDWLKGGTVDAKVRVKRRQVLRDAPRLVCVPIQDFIAPPGTMADFSRADRCAQRMYMSEHEVRQLAQASDYDVDIDELLMCAKRKLSDMDTPITYEQNWRMQETGDGTTDEDLYELWQIYSYDEDGDESQLMVRMVEPRSMKLLKEEPFPYDHREMPFSVVKLEVNKPHLRDSRGVPEIIYDLESHATAHLRHAENVMQITGNPTIIADHDVEMPGEGEWYAGAVLRGKPGSVGFLDAPRTEGGNLSLMSFYMDMAHKVIGTMESDDLTESSTERRTASEINAIQSRTTLVAGYRISLFLAQMARPLQQVWDLLQQYGPREFFVNIIGEEPVRVTQSEIAGRFSVIPSASVGPADPQFTTQQASMLLQSLSQMGPQMGSSIDYETDIAGLVRYIAQNIDPVMSKAFIRERSPEEKQALVQQMEAQAEYSRQLANMAEKLDQNVGLDPAEALALIKEMQRISPHKGLTRIKENAQAAEGEAARARALA